MVSSANDEHWMQRALVLAGQGVGLATPNPTVGCVLVNVANDPAGEGFHQYALRDHAEVVALRAAGEQARGGTAYVTLEPCTHHGRTGPCADALIAAGIVRVVIATLDANPLVRGSGVARLRAAGVAVEVGVLQAQARRINDAFAKYVRSHTPYVTLKAALSLDGRIAPAGHEGGVRSPFWLTGEDAREEVQKMRHAHDALLTGVGTVMADDPLLTDRSGLARRLPLVRVVLDTHLRTPLASKLVESVGDGDLVLFTSTQNETRIATFTERSIRIERITPGPSGISVEEVLTRLGEIGLSSVLIEAGTRLNTAFLSKGLVDRLVFFYAPILLGEDGLPVLASAHALLPLPRPDVRTFGDDVCVTTTLKSYWPE